MTHSPITPIGEFTNETCGRIWNGNWRLEREYVGGKRLHVDLGHRELEEMVLEPPRLYGMNMETPAETEKRYRTTAQKFLREMITGQEQQINRAAIAAGLRDIDEGDPHVHKCMRAEGDDYCASRGYCECRCGAFQGLEDDEWIPAGIPG